MAAPGGAVPQFASLYVGDLHPDVTEAMLYEIFNSVGPVASIRVCRDSVSRKSLGYGYVNFHNVSDAERALDTLNYSSIKGRSCRIMWSQRDPSLRKSGAGNIYVKNLDKNIDNKALYDTFSLFGNILSCKVATDPTGNSYGYGFVHYETEEAAKQAIEKVDGMMIGEKTVQVCHFQKRDEKGDDKENFTNVYVKNFPADWDEDKIHSTFSSKRFAFGAAVQEKTAAALHQNLASESMERIIKSSSSIENFVISLVGKNFDKEEEVVKITFVDTRAFQNFIYCTILLNALTLGLQADLHSGGWDMVWFVFENIFTTVFAIEMVLKIYFLQVGYFWNVKFRSPQYWNLLDCVIALLAIVDCWILTYQANADAPAIRVMQLLRIIRIAKLLRLRQELVAIIEGLFSSLQCMVWIGFLLMIVIYGFSIVCRNVMGNLTNSDFEDMINNEMHFGTLPRTMLTLFNICLIDSWSAIIWPQMLYNPWMVIPLVVFMCVTCFGLMNALIGVIVERTTAAQQNMSSLQEEAVREMKMYMVAKLLEAIDDSDEDSSGTINLQEFRQVQRKPHAADIFAALNLPPGFEAKDLFALLDSDGNGVLDRYEFLLGICRLIWCDEFQSQCLLNYSISQIREDIRTLQASVKDLSSQATCSRVHGLHEETLKSMAATLRNDYQEILNSSLEKYWERAQALLTVNNEKVPISSVSHQVDQKIVDPSSDPVPVPTVPATPACVEGVDDNGVLTQTQTQTKGALADKAPDETAALLHTPVPKSEEFLFQLPAEILETVERLMDQLLHASGAVRLVMRADGILLVEGCSKTKERLQAILQELVQTGWSSLLDPGRHASPDSGEETSSQPGDTGDGNGPIAATAKGRRKRRVRKAKVPKTRTALEEP